MKKKFKKIYVFCFANCITGGPETLHSIVDVINKNGGDAYIVYEKKGASVPNPYRIYNVKVAEKIEDNADNLLIVSEMSTDELTKYKKINKAILFLSLEYYLFSRYNNRINSFIDKHKLPKCLYSFLIPITYLVKNKKHINFKKIDFNDQKLIIACNGQVNKQYLINKENVSPSRIGYVCGPINTEFIDNQKCIKKQNIVCFNPKKGLDFTKKIVDRYTKKYGDAKFMPINNMTPLEVHELLLKSKVYIDFGNHPGPERIPREAVISNCNIITSTNGSAAFYEDVPISNKYKFEDKDENLDMICDLIRLFILEYERYNEDFKEFRNKVLNQRFVFEKNVIDYFF